MVVVVKVGPGVFEDARLVTAVQENDCSNVEDVASALAYGGQLVSRWQKDWGYNSRGCQVSSRSTSWCKKAGWQAGRLLFLVLRISPRPLTSLYFSPNQPITLHSFSKTSALMKRKNLDRSLM